MHNYKIILTHAKNNKKNYYTKVAFFVKKRRIIVLVFLLVTFFLNFFCSFSALDSIGNKVRTQGNSDSIKAMEKIYVHCLIMNCCEQCGEYLPSKGAGNNVLVVDGQQKRFCCQSCVSEYKQVIHHWFECVFKLL